jgi:hypothetical protein
MRLLIPLALVMALGAVAPSVAFADDVGVSDIDSDLDRDRDRDRDRLHVDDMTQLKTQLREQVRMSQAQVDDLDAPLRRYVRLGGEQAHIRAMVQAGVDAECTGTCLKEMVRSTNRAMVMGMQDNTATGMVQDCLNDQIRDRDRTRARLEDGDLADGIHDRVQDRLRLWDSEQERLRDREMQREVERARTREAERATDRAGDAAGSGRRGR